MVEEKGISIWFFIGSLLFLYGIVITAANIYQAYYPSFGRHTVLENLHFGVWWGILLLIIGVIYVVGFWPWKKHAQSQ